MAREKRRGSALVAGLKALVALVLGLALFAGGFALGHDWGTRGEPRLDASAIEAQIADCSELTSAELTYAGLIKYEDGRIPFISRKAFSMGYSAHVRAGVDLAQADVRVDEEAKAISVVLPAPSIQSRSIDASSIEFYDQSFTLLNWDTKQDAVKAMEAAEADVDAHADATSLLTAAQENAEIAVAGLLAPFAEAGYEVSVESAPAPAA